MMIVMYLYLFSYALYPNIPKTKYSMTCNNLSHVKAKTVGTDLPGIDAVSYTHLRAHETV